MIPTRFTVSSLFLCCLFLLCHSSLHSQVTVAFQGGETGDTWGYTTSASAIAIGEAAQAPNKTNGTTSLVAGGNTGGGSCFGGTSGNGPSVARTFTFNTVDISSSNGSVRTLNFHWGNRYPICNGTGWDAGENLVFTPTVDGVVQSSVTLATGNNNATFSIQSNQYSYTIPACVNTFSFVISVTTNRADELLFLDDVKITGLLNGTNQPSPISGPVSVCAGSTQTYSVTSVAGTSYTWSGLPAGAVFTTPNGTTAAASIGVNWGTVAPGTYTLTVTPSNACGVVGVPQTIDVTIEAVPTPLTISGPTTFCAGNTITLTSNYTTGNSWSTGETTQSIVVFLGGTYTDTIHTACGVLVTSYAVTVDDGPAIQSATATDVSCFGQTDGTITVSATGTSLEYSLDGTTWQTTATFNNLAPGTYTIHVRVTGGCEATTTATVSEPVQLTATASNDGPFCSGTPVTLHGTTNATGTVTWQWTGPNGYTSAQQDPTDATDAGTYSLTVLQNTCSSTAATTTVTITPTPTATTSNGGPYCAGQVIQLTGTSSITGGVMYAWTGPNGYASSVQNPTDATDAGVYTLIVTNGSCASSPVSTVVVVNAIPDAIPSYNAPFCPGNALVLYGTTSVTGTASYAWTGPNGYASSVQNPTDATQAGTYTLTVSANGCSSPAATLNVVTNTPTLTASNTGPQCEGNAVQLNSYTNATGTLAYSWSGPNGYSTAVPNPSDVLQSGIYTLTLTANGCVATVSTVVTILPSPVAAFTVNNMCVLETGEFHSQSTVGTPQSITSWNWHFGDGATAIVEQPNHPYATSGNFEVSLQVTTNAGCTAATTQSVTVFERPKANFFFSPNEVSDLDPEVQFVNSSSFADTYLWSFNPEGGATSTDPSPLYTFPEIADQYTVQLIAYNAVGCSDTIVKILPVAHSIVYFVPNAFTPDGDEFNNIFRPVFAEGFDPHNYTLMIFDRWGEVIFESHDPNNGWDGTYHDTLQADGTYVWNILFKHRDTDAYENVTGSVTMLH